MAEHKDIDAVTGVDTTGHEWDGIKELNNPLPRWWLWTFYACVIWAFLYMIAYPAVPMISQATQGVLGYDSRKEVAVEIAEAGEAKKVWREKIAALDFDAIRADADLMRFAQNSGAATFRTYCAQCHGAGAAGALNYPNLLDDDWIWGGDIAAIHQTITHGVRAEGIDETRSGPMPAFGRDGLLEAAQIEAVADYVLQISGQPHDAARATEGAAVFAENCASCHGEDGKGIRDVGAPNLTDVIWLYGGAREAILASLKNGRGGVMPAWGPRLSPEQVKEVALYVHSLGGGE